MGKFGHEDFNAIIAAADNPPRPNFFQRALQGIRGQKNGGMGGNPTGNAGAGPGGLGDVLGMAGARGEEAGSPRGRGDS